MPHIYRGASRVMIWLGNRSDDADLLRRIKSSVRDAKAYPEAYPKECPGDLTLYLTPRADEAAEAREMLNPDLSLSMSQLGRLAWFTRRWILQELALNANAVLCCGQTELPWPQLAGVLRHNDDVRQPQVGRGRRSKLLYPNHEEDAGLRNIQLLWELWLNTTISTWPGGTHLDFRLRSRDIAALMSTYSNFECSDSRDQIAALLGLSCDAQGPTGFRVDYADSVEQTYVKFAETLVRTGHLAWLLYQRFQREKERTSRGTSLPSWVPGWRLRMVAPPLHSQCTYLKTPASGIHASHTADGVHMLTTHFWRLPFAEHESRKSLKCPVHADMPAVVSPPFVEILWKSTSFPEGSGVDERLALVLVDLWPRIVARFSEDAKTSRRKMWYALLLQVAFTLYRGRDSFDPYALYLVSDDEYPTFGEDDVSDLEALRRYTRSWVQKHFFLYESRWGQNSKGLAECLVFCQEASDCLDTGSVCGMGCVPASFYNQVMVGDKVLLANLGHFRVREWYTREVGMAWSRHIVREKRAAPEASAGSAVDGLKSTEQSFLHGINSCCNQGSKSNLVSPWVYEFLAPCQAFNSFPWTIRFLLPSDPDVEKLDRHFFAKNDFGNGVKDSDEVHSIWIC